MIAEINEMDKLGVAAGTVFKANLTAGYIFIGMRM